MTARGGPRPEDRVLMRVSHHAFPWVFAVVAAYNVTVERPAKKRGR